MKSLKEYLLEAVTENPHEIARKNAMLPIEKGGLGLPETNTASDRAKAMGFDIDNIVYHGTDEKFKEFDPKTIGSNHIDSRNGGFFFTQSQRVASSYGKHVNPYLLKKDNAHIIELPTINPRFEDPNYPTKVYHNPIDVYDTKSADLLDKARYDDRDSITVKGFKNNDLRVVFKPHHIRSLDAAFDPMKKDSGDLLA